MKVKYRVTNPESPEPDYEAVETVPCCQECLDAWERETFTFEAGVDLDTDESVAIVCVRAYEHTDEGEFESALPMYYCPFCGTGILCVEIDD